MIIASNSYADIVGSMGASFAVNEMGAATYTIPIEVPQGLNNLQPNIILTYNSQAGNGVCGMGFSISGLSVITRVPRSIYYDGVAQPIKYDNTDMYALNGQRLFCTSGTYGQDKAVYQLENDLQTKVIQHGIGKSQWFEVRSNGITTKIGRTNVSRQMINNVIVAWHVDYANDSYNNYMSYIYVIDNNCMYIDSIKYGANIRLGTSAENIIKFKYASRSDAIPFTINGVSGKMAKRLSNIVATPMNTKSAYRTYTFSYTNTTDYDNLSRMTSVTVKGAGNQTLRPIEFKWNTVSSITPSIISFSNASNISVSDQQMISADVTGNGKNELIMVSNEDANTQKYYIYSFNDNGSFSHLCNESLKKDFELDSSVVKQKEPYGFNVADLDGDCKNDILIPIIGKKDKSKDYTHFNAAMLSVVNSKLRIKYYTPSALGKTTKSAPLYSVSDFYNYGIASVLYLETEGASGVYCGGLSIPQSTKFDLKFKLKLPSKPLRLFAADFNNDGLQDIMVLYVGGSTIYWNQGVKSGKLPFSENDAKKYVSTKSFLFTEQDIVNLGDFNGDGLVDIIMKRKDANAIYVAYSKGNGDFDKKLVSNELDIYDRSYTERDDKRINIEVIDFNNDGKSDAVVTFSEYKDGSQGKLFESPWGKFVKTYTYWLKSDGTKLTLYKTSSSNKADDGLSNCFASGDFNGDGFVELINYGYNCYSSTNANVSPAMQIYGLSSGKSVNKISCIVGDLGRRNEITYSSLTNTNCYTKGSGSTFPLADITLPMSVVASTSENNGMTSDINISYKYQGLEAHLQGKGILGFKTIQSDNTTTSEVRELTINSWNPTYYVPVEIIRSSKNGIFKTTSITSFTIKGKGGKRYFSYPSTIKDTDIYGQTIITTNNYNQTYGYITQQRIDYAENMFRIIKNDKYIEAGGKWLPQVTTTQQRHSDDKGTFSSTTKRKYNSAGDIAYEIRDSATVNELQTKYSYDKAGNITAISVVAKDVASPPATKYTYDATGRFVTNKESGYLKYSYEYDVFGNLITEYDNSDADNPLKTTYKYDNFGTLTQKTDPLGVKTTITLGFEDAIGLSHWVKTETTNSPWEKVMYDNLGREVRRESVGELGISNTVATTYDVRGNVISTTTTNGNITITKQYQYDAIGRVTAIKQNYQQPTGGTKTTTYTYSKNKVTMVENGKTYTKTTDAMGFTTKVTDQLMDVTYTYSSCGEPLTITTGDATCTITYNKFGLRTSISDPDAGKTTYTYDALGRVITSKNANGKVTTNTYNKYGNLTKCVCDDIETTYSYDALQNLTEEKTNNGNSTSYTYDKYGRITRQVRNIGNKRLQFDYGYSRNLLSTKVFPDNTRQQYKYDQYGYTTCVTILNDTIWLLSKNNGTERIANLGKSLSLHKSFTPNGFISNNAIYKNNNTLHSMSYLFNEHKGELTIRTGMLSSGASEYFSFDKHDRLTSCSVANTPTQNFAYASNGNILTKDFRRLTYDTNKPHAVVGKTDTRETNQYTRTENSGDPNPFLNSIVDSEFKDQAITYTPFNKVETIMQCVDAVSFGLDSGDGSNRTAKYTDKNGAEKSYSIPQKAFAADYVPLVLTYSYGPDRQRCKLEEWAGGPGGQLNQVFTKYYADGYEEIIEKKTGNTYKYYYLYTPDGLTAVVQRTKIKNASSVTKYLAETDYLGSIIALYDQTGNRKFRAEYDAWGQQKILQNDLPYFTRGFTGHEHLREFELIDMNGRMYDPTIGRFLSPDPYIQAPTNSQNFNRYSYCLNNPLKYTDPSGESIVAAVIIGAIAGTYIGGSLANNNSNPMKWNYNSGTTWRYMFWGSVVGCASGAMGGAIAISGMPFANTTSIAFSSFFNSIGTSLYSDGKSPISISLGAASYDFTNDCWGFLGKKGNKKIENWGYGLGAMANVSDILVGFNPKENIIGENNNNVELELRTENHPLVGQRKDIIGHSQLVEVTDNYANPLIDWGPAEGYGVTKISDIVPGANSYEGGALSANVMKWAPVKIKGVNIQRIRTFSGHLNKGGRYNFAFSSCVSQTSRALNMSGVFNIGIHPYLLHTQMYLRSIGIRPMLFSYYLNNYK